MAGYDDEQKFDAAAPDLITVEGLGPRIHCPYLAIGGEDDELTGLETTFALLDDITAPPSLPPRSPRGRPRRVGSRAIAGRRGS
jgi:hypothetical protein